MRDNAELGESLHMQSTDTVQTIRSTRMSGTEYVRLYDNGVAIISLIGPIFPRANMMTMSGATSISQFVSDFAKAEANPDVKGIVMEVDSPGGDVRGIGDAAKAINAISKQSKKPIRVFASGFMCSAAYYVASAVGKGNLIASESALIGSIGVVLNGKINDKNEIEIVSSQSPKKRPDPSSEDGRAILQERVDDLADIFVKDVAKYRGISRSTVLSDYGQGNAPVAPRALKQGLIDRIGTLSAVVEEMASGTMTQRSRTRASEETEVEALLHFNDEDNNYMLKDILNRFRASEPIAENEPSEPGQVATASRADDEPAVAAIGPDTPEEEATDVTASEDPITPVQAQLPSREELEERFSDAAELFATKMTLDSRIFPAHAAHAASEMLTARIDDALIGGSIKFVDEQGQIAEGTREAAVTARYMAMPKHTMTQQAIAGIKDGTVAATVLADNGKDTKDAPMSEERRKALLAQSSTGQAVLNTAQ